MKYEFKDGSVLEAEPVAKAVNVILVRDKDGKYYLVSILSLKDGND